MSQETESCCICVKPAIPGSPYCARCTPPLVVKPQPLSGEENHEAYLRMVEEARAQGIEVAE